MAKTKTTGYKQELDGTWSIDTKVKIDGTWRHFHKKGYPTLSSARLDFENAKAKFIKEKESCHKTVLFEDLVREYEEMRSIIVDQSTLECDRGAFNNYILPYFEGRLIKDVFTVSSIVSWYKRLVASPKYTNNKKAKVITRMKDLLKFAYTHKYINAEVYQDCDVNIYQVKYSKKPATERIIWTDEEERKFIEALSINKRDSLMFRIFLATSPRLGEFLGLQGRSFDYKKNRIIIDQQVKNVAGKGAILTDKLKTHESYRTVVIPTSLSIELKEYVDSFNIKPEQFIWFYTDRNQPISRNTIRRLFDKYCDLAGVRRMNLHALRHNQAVKLARVSDSAEMIEVAAKRLGHSPSMFLNTYAKHSNDEAEIALMKRLSDA